MNAEQTKLIEKIKKRRFELTGATPVEKEQFEELLVQTRNELKTRNKQLEQKSITVKQLFQHVRFYDLMPYLETYTEMDGESTAQYKKIFESVKQKKEHVQERFILMDATGDETPDVYSMEYDKGIHFSLSFVAYEKLANYNVHPWILETYSKEEIAAGILEEFSWFTEDEEKEAMKEDLEMKVEEIEKNEAIEKAEEEGVISIFGPSATTKEQDERGEKKIPEEETIRHYAQEMSFEKIKTALEEHYEHFEEEMCVKKEEALRIIKEQFFVIKKKINQTPPQKTGDRVRFNGLTNFIEVKREDKKVKCLYSGDTVFEVIDQTVNRTSIFSNKAKEVYYLLFIFALFREKLCNQEAGKEDYKEEVQYAKKNLETIRIIEKAKTGLHQLTTKELLRFSHVIEAIKRDY